MRTVIDVGDEALTEAARELGTTTMVDRPVSFLREAGSSGVSRLRDLSSQARGGLRSLGNRATTGLRDFGGWA